MSVYGVHKLCRAALHDEATRRALLENPAAAMQAFPLTDDEKRLLLAGDVATLYERGASGFLLSYFTRWEIFGLGVEVYSERMRAAKDWRWEGAGEVASGR